MDEFFRSWFWVVKDWIGCDCKILFIGLFKIVFFFFNCVGIIGSIRIFGFWFCVIWLLFCGMLGFLFWKDFKMELLNCSCLFMLFKELILLGFMLEVDEDIFFCFLWSLSFSSVFWLWSFFNCFSFCCLLLILVCDDKEFCLSVCCDWVVVVVDLFFDVFDVVVWFEVIIWDEFFLVVFWVVFFVDL